VCRGATTESSVTAGDQIHFRQYARAFTSIQTVATGNIS
jgi:hypothetical protein